ncbi:lysylphosphatidylglycerol synthase transmembrane domain-containing protein [Streptomyces coelicoflavus]|uniref:lysylphosphatidylglycerol synthase transmembrane domain-containing protein n=1 Tax=Streptomyces coelicoflavus TaxID=285562 RepID=UPI000D58F512
MPADGRGVVSALRTHLGTLAGTAVLAVLVWRLGTGAFLDGLRRIDAPTVLAALGIGLVTTVFSAWRWALVARGLRIRLPLGGAVADYYRALFLNAALPGGVLGDVHRAVRHGQSAGDLGRGVRAVVLERAAGQVALMGVGVAVLLTMPSPVLAGARRLAPLVALALLCALAVVLALRMNRTPEEPTLPRQALPRRAFPRRTLARRALPRRTPARRTPARRAPALRAVLGEAREGLLSRRNLPGVAGSSVVVLAGHLAMFVLAARVAGSGASVAVLTPLAVLALLAMGLPLNVGGWGPREGVTVWAFGAAGLGAGTGLGVAVVYGVLSLAASLPGAVVLVARRRAVRYARLSSDPVTVTAVSSAKHSAKESARPASSSFPFSADPSEGRPMTPEAV